jgi:alpha-L-fucosidase
MKPHSIVKCVALLWALGPWVEMAPGAPVSPDANAVWSRHETAEQRDARMAWFREARFGLFIHWGVYSVPAGEFVSTQNGQTRTNRNLGEWFLEETKMPVSEYEKYADQFNPVKFDAREWVRLAKDAGMKYLVITSKHHDGFGLWDSKLTDWDMGRTPFKRDPLKELADACQQAGLRLCFYHSIMDWHHPDWGTRRKHHDKLPATPPDMDRYTDYMKGQLKELLTGYGPIGIAWFDGEWESPWTHERGGDLDNFVRGLQPHIIVNNRVGKGRSGMQGMDKGKGVGDYGTPEQEIPPTGFGPGVDWESCMTMNNHWGYNKHDQNWKSTRTLIRNLIDCASKGGNYLLNVGPTSEGLIPQPSVQRLAEIGAWMKVNREAIHGTTASPFKKLAWGKCTQKPGRLYLFVYDWPKDGRLVVPVGNAVKQAALLATRQVVKAEKTDVGIARTIPAAAPDAHAAVIRLEIEGAPQVLAASPTIKQAADGTLVLKASDAELVGRTIALETKGDGAPNIGHWTDQNDYVQWPVQITKPGTFDVEVTWACEPGSEGAECVMKVGDQEIVGKVEATGSWSDFRTETGGQCMVEKAGPLTITVKARTKPGVGVVNLRHITLKPAN